MESDEGTTVDTPKRIEELEAQLEQLEEQVINSKAEAESTIDNCIKLTWELESEKDKLSTKQWKAGIDRSKLEEAIAIRLQDDSAHKSMVAEAEAKTRRIKSLRKHKDAPPPDLVGEMEALEKLKEEIRQFKAEKTADLREKYDLEILGLSSEIRVSKREIERMEKTISDGLAEWGKLKRKNTDLLMRAFILGEEKRKIEDEVVRRFGAVVSDCISQALALSYPAIAAAPHMFVNGYNNALAVAVETDYSFPLADGVKEYLADPAKFAVAAVDYSSDDDIDMGFPLFDD